MIKHSEDLKGMSRKQKMGELRKIWEANLMPGSAPMSLSKISRSLFDAFRIKQTRGRSLGICVIAHFYGLSLEARNTGKKKKIIPTKDRKKEFYGSWEWRTLRIKVLNEFGARCMCCGATPEHKDMNGRPVKIVVDHIKSLHKHWELRLKRDNLQVLCEECNMGKGAWDETDHRPKQGPDEWIIEDDVPECIREQLKYTH